MRLIISTDITTVFSPNGFNGCGPMARLRFIGFVAKFGTKRDIGSTFFGSGSRADMFVNIFAL